MTRTVTIIEGKIEHNPYGNWDDVDKGWYVDHENVEDLLLDLNGKHVKITIEEIDAPE